MRPRWLELAVVLAVIALVARISFDARHGDSPGAVVAELLFEVMIILMAAFVGLRWTDRG